jgi:hypothetical protein
MNTMFLSSIKIVFLSTKCINQLYHSDLGIINAFNCNYRKQLIQKTVAMMDTGLLQDATHMKTGVQSAVYFIGKAWRLIATPPLPKKNQTPWPLVRKRTIPTERPPLDEI